MTNQNQQAQVVERILAAETLYDVLGVSKNETNNSTLRKAYLTTSVQVHPDKNPHPQATEAFQRVAEAWGTLSDDSERAEYDAELRNTCGRNNNYKTNTSHYANDFERSHMPSFQEALFMFATAASIISSATSGAGSSASRGSNAANAASDFVETLFWAQKLAKGRQDYDGDQSRSTDNTTSTDPLTSGMALGTGLRAIATAQRAMGMTQGAKATEKAATAAMLGATVLHAAHDNPAVKRSLERAGQSALLKKNPKLVADGVLRKSVKVVGSILSALAEVREEEEAHAQQQQHQRNGGNRR